jgi:hypothetical protein
VILNPNDAHIIQNKKCCHREKMPNPLFIHSRFEKIYDPTEKDIKFEWEEKKRPISDGLPTKRIEVKNKRNNLPILGGVNIT